MLVKTQSLASIMDGKFSKGDKQPRPSITFGSVPCRVEKKVLYCWYLAVDNYLPSSLLWN